MNIPENKPAEHGVVTPPEGRVGEQSEATSPNTKRKVKVVQPNNTSIDNQQPDASVNKKLNDRGIEAVIVEPDNLPSVKSASSNVVNFPDGSIFVEANEDPEAAAGEAVKNIKDEHGEESASKAKALFGKVLKFCKEHKGVVLGVVGFAFIVGGVAATVAGGPVALLLLAPGVIMMGYGLGEMSDFPLPPLPPLPEEKKTPAGTLPKADPKKTEGEEPELDKSEKKSGKTGSVQAEPSSKEESPLSSMILDPSNDRYKELLGLKKFREKQHDEKLSMSFLPKKPRDMHYSEILRACNGEKLGNDSQLKLSESEEIDLYELYEQKNLSEEDSRRAASSYAKVDIGLDHFLWHEGIKDPDLRRVQDMELIALRKEYKKKAKEVVKRLIEENKTITPQIIAQETKNELEAVTASLKRPASSKEYDSSSFHSNVNKFLDKFAESLKSNR